MIDYDSIIPIAHRSFVEAPEGSAVETILYMSKRLQDECELDAVSALVLAKTSYEVEIGYA